MSDAQRSWGLDWFTARDLAKAGLAFSGIYIRRAEWSDFWIGYYRAWWWKRTADMASLITVADFTANDFAAQDYTILPPGDQCAAAEIYLAPKIEPRNPLGLGKWGDAQVPPPAAPFFFPEQS